MKNIITKYVLIIIVSFISLNVNAQIIIDMAGDDNTYPSDYLSTGQYYIKDISNNLDNFTGTWEYVNGNKKFELILTKTVYYHVVYPDLELDYYEDGIYYQYKKYVNNTLVFESPINVYTYFDTTDGIILKGWIKDYGRISKTLYLPFSTEVYVQGGEPVAPICRITKQPEQQGEPTKVFFNLDLTGTVNYDKETYEGQSTFSIPNEVLLTKVE